MGRIMDEIVDAFDEEAFARQRKLQRDRGPGSVVQAWLSRATLKQQTVVLCALRGCDGLPKEDPAKPLVRWLRSLVLRSANPNADPHSFMDVQDSGAAEAAFFLHGVDHYPVHWVLHFAHACQIIGMYHPDPAQARNAERMYLRLVHQFHMKPESAEENCERLADQL